MTQVPPEDHVVADLHMAGNADVIGHDDIVADQGIVRHMSIGHDQAIIADPGQHASALGAGIDGHRFPDGAAFADLEPRILAVKFQVLRLVTHRGEGEDARIPADAGIAFDNGMRHQLDIVAEDDLRADNGIGADAHTRPQHGAVGDDGCGVNGGFAHESALTIIAVISASAMTTPLTLASAL